MWRRKLTKTSCHIVSSLYFNILNGFGSISVSMRPGSCLRVEGGNMPLIYSNPSVKWKLWPIKMKPPVKSKMLQKWAVWKSSIKKVLFWHPEIVQLRITFAQFTTNYKLFTIQMSYFKFRICGTLMIDHLVVLNNYTPLRKLNWSTRECALPFREAEVLAGNHVGHY
jgi:hypothetical protein